jgi:hypothetical protein
MRNLDGGNQTASIAQNLTNATPKIADAFLVMLLVVVGLGLIISSYFIDNHPVYFFLFFLGIIPVLFVSLSFANVAYDTSVSGTLSATYAEFPMTFYIIRHWIYYAVIIILGIGAALYAKNRIGGGY